MPVIVEIEKERIRAMTLKAILVVNPDGEEVWLPLSQCEMRDCGSDPNKYELSMRTWVAEQKGFA